MARPKRLWIKGVPQHVVQRGNNRQATFFCDDDYRFYLACLEEAVEKYQCDVHAYVLMTNHVHLLMVPEEQTSIARVMQSVGRRYVRYVNHVYERTGTLWEGRYKASLVDSERYLLTCYRYIELNPVRAGMVESPEEYKWSSYRAHARGEVNRLVTDAFEYTALGKTDELRQVAYRALFNAHIERQV